MGRWTRITRFALDKIWFAIFKYNISLQDFLLTWLPYYRCFWTPIDILYFVVTDTMLLVLSNSGKSVSGWMANIVDCDQTAQGAVWSVSTLLHWQVCPITLDYTLFLFLVSKVCLTIVLFHKITLLSCLEVYKLQSFCD